MSTLPSDRAERTTDGAFAFALGFYLGLLSTAPVLAAVVRSGIGDAGVLYGVGILTLAAVTALGWLATWRRTALAVRLGRSRARWLPAALAGVYSLGSLLLAPTVGVVALVAFFFGTIAAVVPGAALVFVARSRYTDTVLAGTTEYESFTAGWPDRARNRLVLAMAPVFVLGLACLGAVFWFEHVGWLVIVGQLLLPAATMPFNRTSAHTYTLSDGGVGRSIAFGRTVNTWDRFEGYSTTDDAVVLHRRWDLDMRFARDEIDDEAVVATVDRFLPQRE